MSSAPDAAVTQPAPPRLSTLPGEILHFILTGFDVELAELYALRSLDRAVGAAATRALVEKLHHLLVVEKDASEVFIDFVRAVRGKNPGALAPRSLGCLLRAARLLMDSFVTISVIRAVWRLEDERAGSAKGVGALLNGMHASPKDAVGILVHILPE